jgi:hypothetical protein
LSGPTAFDRVDGRRYISVRALPGAGHTLMPMDTRRVAYWTTIAFGALAILGAGLVITGDLQDHASGWTYVWHLSPTVLILIATYSNWRWLRKRPTGGE